MQEMLTLLAEKGGVVMLVLFALSIYSLAVILLKAWQFFNCRLTNNPVAEEVLMLLEAEEVAKAKRHAKADGTPMGTMLYHVMDTIQNEKLTPSKRHAEIHRVGNNIVKDLESHLKGLDLVTNVGPLLGLLGTVAGMIKAFSRLEGAGARVDPAMLAGGIWEALLTTVGGLAIAIPAMAAYYIFDSLVEKFRTDMKDAVTRVIEYDSMIAGAKGSGGETASPQLSRAPAARVGEAGARRRIPVKRLA